MQRNVNVIEQGINFTNALVVANKQIGACAMHMYVHVDYDRDFF